MRSDYHQHNELKRRWPTMSRWEKVWTLLFRGAYDPYFREIGLVLMLCMFALAVLSVFFPHGIQVSLHDVAQAFLSLLF